MAIESRNTLKTYFETGDVPTEAQFGNFIDSGLSLSDDGVYVYEDPITLEKRFGIGIVQPDETLGIKAQGTNHGLISLHNLANDDASWLINLFPDGATDTGFNIEQQTAIGAESRFFINSLTGNIGIGTLTPDEDIQIERSNASSTTGVKLVNLATVANTGWIVGHLNDPLAGRDGALTFFESGADEERMILSQSGKLGVNDGDPQTFLHVGDDITLGRAVISLVEDSGTAIIGPITDNLVFDYKSVQARHGEYVDSVLELEIADLGLQPLGGNIVIHEEGTAESLVVISENGELMLGTSTPLEKVTVDGAIVIGGNDAENEGTIRWTGTDFEGRTATDWKSLTAGGGLWTAAGDSIYYDSGTVPRVAIGTDEPDATLQVNDTESVTLGNRAAWIKNDSTTTSSGQDDNRIGLQVTNTVLWEGDPLSKDCLIYASRVSGQVAPECNLAAALNGNVVVGDLIPGSDVIGTGGYRVLAIQNGIAPSAEANSSSVQLYAEDLNGTSTLHILRGNTETIKIYQESALTTADSTQFPVSYDSTTIAILNNMRLRIDELELKLQAIGMLA